jgi:hypothetical protein
MVKVLLIFEDYAELSLTEIYLKRVGFDVVGISNEALLADKLLSFNPEVAVAYGKGTKVSSLSVGKKLRESFRYHGKVILVVPKSLRPTLDDMIKVRMDVMMEAPLNPEKFIQALARLINQSPAIYLDKLQRMRRVDSELDRKIIKVSGTSGAPQIGKSVESATTDEVPSLNAVSGSAPDAEVGKKSVLSDPDRIQKYTELIKDTQIDVQQSTHQRKDNREKQGALKKNWDFEKLEEQDALKRQFAEALFKKKK